MVFGSLGGREKSVEKIAKLNSEKVGHIFAPKKRKEYVANGDLSAAISQARLS